MTIRFGLLGAGRIGKVHAKAVTGNPAARLVAVSDAMRTLSGFWRSSLSRW